MNKTKAAIIEFLLFASPKPLTIVQLKSLLGDIKIEEIKEGIEWLRETCYSSERALQICETGGGFQIATRPAYHPWLKRLAQYQVKPRLSQAALEVLAIITYKQPITRTEIDEIRGVNSGPLLRNLLKQRLIQVVGKKMCLGRPVIYGTGKDFLEYFGLKDLKELPREEELKELIADDDKGQ